MINVFKKPLLPLIGLLTLVVVLTSCEKDENGNSGKIELLSFGPSGVRHGDTLSFIGTNLNKVTAIQFTGEPAALVEQKDFKQQTSEIILLIVPPAAEKGYVTLKTPEGDIVTKTLINLDALTAFASFTPQARPGENITITGDYLNWVTGVTFARDKIVESFVSQSIDELVTSLAVVAVEIYASVAAAPGELQRNAPSYACGLVVVWTGRR